MFITKPARSSYEKQLSDRCVNRLLLLLTAGILLAVLAMGQVQQNNTINELRQEITQCHNNS